MIEQVTGDLFASGLPALAHGCNCRGVMGAGIARQFRDRWPAMYAEYRRQCEEGVFRPGYAMRWESPDGRDTVFNLGTQLNPGPCASLEATGQSVTEMLRQAAHLGIPAIGMPRIGCGIGGLQWGDVHLTLERCKIPQVRLVVYTLPEPPPWTREELDEVRTRARIRSQRLIKEDVCPSCGHGVWSHGDYGECSDCMSADPEGPCASGGNEI